MKNAQPLAYYHSHSFNITLITNHQWRKSFTQRSSRDFSKVTAPVTLAVQTGLVPLQ